MNVSSFKTFQKNIENNTNYVVPITEIDINSY